MTSKTSIVAAAALAVVGWGASTSVAMAKPTPAPITPAAPTTAPNTPPALNTMEHDGVYAVGKDILPGTYATAGPIDNKHRCYWRRMNALDPSVPNNVIDSAMTSKPQVVLIDPNDKAFKTSGCQPWHVTDAAPDSTGPSPNLSPQARLTMDLLNNLGNHAAGPAPAPAPAPAPGN